MFYICSLNKNENQIFFIIFENLETLWQDSDGKQSPGIPTLGSKGFKHSKSMGTWDVKALGKTHPVFSAPLPISNLSSRHTCLGVSELQLQGCSGASHWEVQSSPGAHRVIHRGQKPHTLIKCTYPADHWWAPGEALAPPSDSATHRPCSWSRSHWEVPGFSWCPSVILPDRVHTLTRSKCVPCPAAWAPEKSWHLSGTAAALQLGSETPKHVYLRQT